MMASYAHPCADSTPAPLHPSRPRRPRRYGCTPIDPLPGLTGNASKVLTVLEYFARFSYPDVYVSQIQVAAKAGVSRRGVQICYNQLEKAGCLIRERGYRPTHQCARITLRDPSDPPPQSSPPPDIQISAPMEQPDDAPMAQIDDAPMAQKPCTYGAKNGASMAQVSAPYVHNPTLYKELNTEKRERETSPIPFATEFPYGIKPLPRFVRAAYRDAENAKFMASLNAGLVPHPLDSDSDS